jgi:exonuclease SbcC
VFDTLSLHNFQSHEKTDLKFCPGINVIVGPSDNGKSAILRALYWLLQNKPEGLGYVSHWNLTEKGIIKSPTEVTLALTDGKSITRYRDKEVNRYILDGERFDAIKRDIPEEVRRVLGMNEINIQKQLDQHFLLSSSAGEVARVFNRTIRLDVIDEMLALVESKKRDARRSLESVREECQKTEEDLCALSWVDDVDALIQKVESIQERVHILQESIQVLDESCCDYEEAQRQVDAVDVSEVELLIGKIERIQERNRASKEIINNIQESIRSYDDARIIVEDFQSVDRAESLIKELETIFDDLSSQREAVQSLGESFDEYQRLKTSFEELEDVSDVTAELDEIQKRTSDISELRRRDGDLSHLLLSYVDDDELVKHLAQELEDLYHSLPDLCPLCEGTGRLRK